MLAGEKLSEGKRGEVQEEGGEEEEPRAGQASPGKQCEGPLSHLAGPPRTTLLNCHPLATTAGHSVTSIQAKEKVAPASKQPTQ